MTYEVVDTPPHIRKQVSAEKLALVEAVRKLPEGKSIKLIASSVGKGFATNFGSFCKRQAGLRVSFRFRGEHVFISRLIEPKETA